MLVEVKGPFLGKATVCDPILRSLPEWFGIESANLQYIQDIEVMPTFLAFIEGKIMGFLTLKRHNEYSEEIHVMGVTPNVHRKGIGRALLSRTEEHLKRQRVEYIQVKTLSSRHPDSNYALTRKFFLALGFRPLEEFTSLWDEDNPALLMVKRL